MRKSPLLIALAFPFAIHAKSLTVWKCTALDTSGQSWFETSHYPKTAITRALDRCKKNSLYPVGCYATRELCKVYSSGYSQMIYWRCATLDLDGAKWNSGPYASKERAAIASYNFCKKWSQAPSTCYTNMLTCTKAN